MDPSRTVLASSLGTFEAVCLPLQASLMSKAMSLAGDRAHAEDLVQEAILRALLAWPGFKIREGEDLSDRASAWMHRILMRRFLDAYRNRVRHDRANEAFAHDVIAGTIGSEAHQTSSRVSKAVQNALEQLDPESRDVVVRVDVHGEIYREIAEETGMALGTVKSRLHRARRRLGELLATG